MRSLSMPLPYVFCAKFSKLLVFMMGLNHCIIMGLGFQTEFAGCSLALNIQISRVMRKPTSVICENKGTNQLHSNCEADKCLCFPYTDSTMPPLSLYFLNPKPPTSSHAPTAWFMSDLFVNHIVGFLVSWFK